MILSAIHLSRVLTGLVCLVVGIFMIVRYKRVGAAFQRWRFRFIGWVGSPDEYWTPGNQEVWWQMNAIVAGILLLIFAAVNFATAWS